MHFGHNPYLFILFSGLVFLCYGDIFSNFPATCADTFGGKYAAGNAGTLYTAKGAAALLVPVASLLSISGGWNAVFVFAACISVMAGLCAKIVLAPMRREWIRRSADLVDDNKTAELGVEFAPAVAHK
jgi:MFS transporter, OFA family, oxalate/formate antiporter